MPNGYPYSVIIVDTMDLFFESKISENIEMKAMDDVESLLWMKVDELNPEFFGLSSIKKGISLIMNIYK